MEDRLGKLLFAPAFWFLRQFGYIPALLFAAVLATGPTFAALVLSRSRGGPLDDTHLYALIAALFVVVLYLLVAVRNFLALHLAQVRQLTERISAGELVDEMPGGNGMAHGQNGAAVLLDAVLKMNRNLGQVASQVRTSAENVALNARAISEGNSHLAQRTHEQAASLEETASGVEQLAATAQRNAETCTLASRMAASSKDTAAKAAGQMREVAATMQRIDASSRRVAEILGTVEGIAFQTNILALNAAVEAARAGEQGRGFAVVAAEVRSLAQRSATAAREIKSLISASGERVESGTQLVNNAGSTMSEIVASVQRVTDIIGEISAATREQSDGIRQMNAAVTQLDQMTQQNAALVEESAAAAESLRDQSSQLTEAIAVFRLK